MRLNPQSIEINSEGLLIQGPLGAVLLSKSGTEIQAEYRGRQLINGSARRYAEQVKQAAIETAQRISLPWSVHACSGIVIHDHRSYYEQTFSPALAAHERLKLWMG